MTRRLPFRGSSRNVRTVLAAVALLSPALAPAADLLACDATREQTRLRVQITGLRNDHGNVTLTLYPDDPRRFLASGGKLARIRVKAGLPETDACLVMPAPGWYALSLYHDENDDHHFKRNWLGLPAEGYGFSNNPKTRTGLPSFAAVRFEAKAGDTAMMIRVNYQ